MLWTGGKDSALALHEAARIGCDVRCLVTFVPSRPRFLAHPLSVITMQAEALQLPHHALEIVEPFEDGYEAALRRLRNDAGVDTVVTGDIAEVDRRPNWIGERARAIGMHAFMPLWERDRSELLQRMLDDGFKALVSCVDTRWLDRRWAGRELDSLAIAELEAVRKKNGLDICGENGEYHTLVVDGPMFRSSIDIGSFTRRSSGLLAHIEIGRMSLIPKDPDAAHCE